jgi:hypothetical protein
MDKLRKYLSETPDSYIVLNEFLTSSEKECIKYDKKNEEIYSSLLNRAEKAKKALGNSILSINIEVPLPPRPSNRDRFLIWKKRNTRKPVIQQSQAVLFLNSRNFVLDRDYEAYQAIDLANEIKKNENIPLDENDPSLNFDNIYTKDDTNIFRQRTMMNAYPEDKRNSVISNSFFMRESPIPPSPQSERRNSGANPYKPPENKPEPNIPEEEEVSCKKEQVKPSAPPISRVMIYPELNDCALKGESNT